MSIFKWLLSHFPAKALPKPAQDDNERLIARLQSENDALRRQESMNMANRDEINRLHRELNQLKESKPATLARLTYDELIEEAKKRRQDQWGKAARPAQQQSVTSFRERHSASPIRRSGPTYTTQSEPPSMLPTYVTLAAMHSSNAAAATASSTDCHSSSSSSYSDSGSSSSSSDSGSSSCDSGGGF